MKFGMWNPGWGIRLQWISMKEKKESKKKQAGLLNVDDQSEGLTDLSYACVEAPC